MTKILKNVFISICGIFAFLFAGFFFVGCGVDYSKIQLSCDKTTVNLQVGESTDLIFKIENYQNGFSNKIDFNNQSSGMTSIFSCSTPTYLSEDEIKVTVTGVAGGSGKLEVRTLEAGKTCEVNIFVEQYSNTMSFDNSVLYVSNKTPFVPNEGLYKFDTNTTHKELSYYYIKSTIDIDFNTFSLVSFQFGTSGDYAVLSDGVMQILQVPVVKFDKVTLDKDNALNLHDGEIVQNVETVNEFNIFAVYDYSMNEDGSAKTELYEEIVYAVSKVHVLPDLAVSISGGYADSITGAVDFSSINDNTIRIVPNNNEMNVYVVKIEMSTSIEGLPIDFKMKKSNDYVDIDFFRDEDYTAHSIEKADNVYYLKISQNTQTQVTTDFSFDIYYNIAQGINDESVNVTQNLEIDVEIAPIALLVNGTSNPEKATLYNFYKFPEYGWNEMVFDVISGLESSPNFNGIYFEFDSDSLEISCDGVNVSSGRNYLYKDLSKSFYIRGAYGCKETEEDEPVELKVHLESDILSGEQTEIVLSMYFDIVAGARNVWINSDYSDLQSSFYFDLNGGEKSFFDETLSTGIIVADAPFQYITYTCEANTDVVDFVFDKQTVCVEGEEYYYLNFKVVPKAVGSGIYTINLDNGMPITLTFNVIKTLTTDDAPFVLANTDNEAVTEFNFTTDAFTGAELAGVPDYANILNMDILNPNKNGQVDFGSRAGIKVVSNIVSGGAKFSLVSGNISMSQGENIYYFSTRENGQVIVSATLTGYEVDERYTRQTKTVKYELRIASYSLLREFYLKNGETAALSSTVYYGGGKANNQTSATFTTYVDNKQTFGFYKYDFTEAAIQSAYENATELQTQEDGTMLYKYAVANDEISYQLKHEFYSDKFVYYYANSNIGLFKPTITATITKNNLNAKKVRLEITSGLMFYAENGRTISAIDVDGRPATYTITFDGLVFADSNYLGEFDVETKTYTNIEQSAYTLHLNAYVRQRNLTKQYEVRIKTEQYKSIESISLASSISQLDFDNEERAYELSVYTYPQTSTSKNIEVVYVSTNGNPYTVVSGIEINSSASESGVYTVKLSCEDFFNNPIRYHKNYTAGGTLPNINDVVDIEDSLTGKIYIFPSEWGSSVSEIEPGLDPIIIDVQYRNGSKMNPYLIETAEDLRKINQNETTLKSHYEVNTVIDLASLKDFEPIGILNGEVVGFSGSIVGANSQATLANINVANNNFVGVVDDVLYGGLFAQLNDDALIENLSFTGSFDINLQNSAYLGLIAAINRGKISNVGTKIDASIIDFASNAVGDNENETLYFGAVAGINAGLIVQNFDLYDESFDLADKDMGEYEGYNFKLDGEDYAYEIDEESGLEEKVKLDEDGNLLPKARDLTGQTPKNLAYFNDFVTINVDENIVYAGGIAGASSGTVKRVLSDKNTLSLYGYSEYSAYTLIKITGTLLNGGAGKYVHVGGAVGLSSFGTAGNFASSDRILPVSDKLRDDSEYRLEDFNMVQNLLIGGEIDTTAISGNNNWKDYVGGIVGYIDTVNTDQIWLSSNTSRVFLRAHYYVGGIVGFDFDEGTYGEGKMSTYTSNIIEAVDDGRNAFYSSLIIKVKKLTGYSSSQGTNFYFVGNALENGRTDYGSSNFESISYLSREKITLKDGDVIDYNYANLQENYGDFLVVEKSGSSYNFASGCHQLYFDRRSVEIGLDATKDDFKMVSTTGGEELPDVYFMYYFSIDGYLNSDVVIDNSVVEQLNIVATDSIFYPFALNGSDVTISSLNSEILSIDLNGVITVKNTGFATLELTSIKNTNAKRKLYVYVVNYFNKDVSSSLYFSSKSSSATNLTSGSLSIVYGNSKTNVYLVPTYDSYLIGTYEELGFSASKNGILKYQNVDYVLSKNLQLTTSAEQTDLTDEYFSKAEVVNQTIIFLKDKNQGGANDLYALTPKLQITFKVDGVEYTYLRELASASIDLEVEYREKASQIYVDSEYTAIKSNEYFDDMITVVSTNPEEMIFYQIFYNGELVQDRLPVELGEITDLDKWAEYINYEGVWADNNNKYKFFDLNFVANGDNTFDYTCEVNQLSERFESRFDQDIYGEYVVYVYASDLGVDGGVSASFIIDLAEAEINYVKMKNYSNIADVSVEDDRLVPSQYGLLEIGIDPIEAVFDEVVVSNSALNYNDGATEATLTFAYEKVTEEGVEYIIDPNFGTYKNGILTFTYKNLLKHVAELNEKVEAENASVSFSGKIYVAYFMPATNVSDLVPVGFDVKVTYGDGNEKGSSVRMTTKLGNYAKLVFDDKDETDEVYYVARGLSYGLTLEYFGFTEDEITISSSNASLASISGQDGKYTLNITSNNISYYDDVGYRIEIQTLAQKTVDDVLIITKDVLTIYIMEYALNYNYIDGVYEDIVKGMEDGVISCAVGNPYTLEFDIYDFLEFDASNEDIVKEVDEFASEMTQRMTWTVYYAGTATTLKTGKEEIRTDYYSINGLIVTPLKIYSAESDVYSFSMDAYYTMRNGVYTFSALATPNRVYTEFEFDVHDQSTEDSPIPIYTYEEFMDMQDGEWYILLEDITLLGESAGADKTAFVPINAEIAGLDGNSKKIILGDTYNFSGYSRVGVFESIGEETVLKNVTIELAHDTVFKMDQTGFEVGLLAAENNGIITNCVVQEVGDSTLSVVSTVSVEGSYVAGLVSTNNAYITHSRSTINIFSNANLSGFVATNGTDGAIASSYFKSGSLKNRTNTTEVTAGFVLENDGTITTSYVSGDANPETVYYAESTDNENANMILSSYNISGFVYSNAGEIADCYTNILLKQSGAFAAGFVFENSGNVNRCFSTSVFESEQSSNYGFARTNYIGEIDDVGTNAGTIKNCFFLQDENPDGDNGTDDGINTSIGEIIIEEGDTNVDLKALRVEEFARIETYFGDFVYAEKRNDEASSAVWFFNDNPLTVTGFGEQFFNTGRLELVAPNLLASSERVLDHVESITDENGASYSKYIYIYKSGSASLGSVGNPITITSAEDFEEYIVQENNKADYNYSHYRLVSDIDYSEYVYNSKTYKTKFMGYLEGNFMTIEGISFVSSESLKNAGLFAEIGSSTIYNAIGTVMNFTLIPEAVSFSNASVVGAVAGKVDGGTIYNVDIKLPSTDRIVVVGQNIVGGAIGLAVGNYKIENLYSQLSAKARNQKQGDDTKNEFNPLSNDYTFKSFAGSVVGVLSGNANSSFENGKTDTAVAVLADKAGLMFGLIDSNARVTNLEVNMLEDMVVNAYSYGGLVAGESKGIVTDVVVNSFDKENGAMFTNFRKVPFIAEAVGGYAGLVSGGELKNIEMYQSIEISNSAESSGIKHIGGIAGQIEKSVSLKNIKVSANLTGFKYVGGIVGNVSSDGSVEFIDVNVNSMLHAVGLKESEEGVGGIAGVAGASARIVLKTSFTDSEDYKTALEGLASTELEVATEVERLEGELSLLTDEAAQKLKQQEIENEKKKVADYVANNLQVYYDKYNQIDVTVSTNVSVYSSTIRIHVGAIVGLNNAKLEHSVCDTVMSIVGSCLGYDYGKAGDLISSAVIVNEDNKLKQVMDPIYDVETTKPSMLAVSTYGAIRTTYYCNLTFSTTDSGSSNVMNVSVFGDATFRE